MPTVNEATASKKTRLNFLQTSVARAGSTVNFVVVGPLYNWLLKDFDNKDALGWTLAISGVTCLVSVLCAIVRLKTQSC